METLTLMLSVNSMSIYVTSATFIMWADASFADVVPSPNTNTGRYTSNSNIVSVGTEVSECRVSEAVRRRGTATAPVGPWGSRDPL